MCLTRTYLSVEGIDINSKTPPSETKMFQLVTNLKLMRVVRRVIDELKAAGFKTNSDVRCFPFGARREMLM